MMSVSVVRGDEKEPDERATIRKQTPECKLMPTPREDRYKNKVCE
jgi:hypothetical protein